MSTWVLVLSIVAIDYRGGPAITAIPGFKTKEECIFYGDAWQKAQPKSDFRYTSICMEQKK